MTDKNTTWIESSECHSDEYQISDINSMNKKGWGLDLICSSKYKAEALPHTQYDSFESTLWSTQLGSTHCTILGVYHTPQGSHNGLTNNIFLDDITNLCTEVSSRFNNIILLDDLKYIWKINKIMMQYC